MTVDEAKELKVARVMCLDDVLMHTRYFYKRIFKRKFVVNSHHEKVCGVLNMVLAGLLTKVIINIGPRYSKTELAVKNFVSSAFAHNPKSIFIHLSYSQKLVEDNSDSIKAIMKSPEYQSMFPDVRISKKNDSKKKWNTTAGGSFYAASTAGQVTGMGAGTVEEEEDFKEFESQLSSLLEGLEINSFTVKSKFGGALIIDDPIKPEDAFSDLLRVKINERWDSTIKNRVNSRRTPIIVMGQRTHEEDLSGHLMVSDGYTTDLQEAINNPDIWYVLAIPVIQEDENGQEFALWPFKHTLTELKKMQVADQMNFDTQYMQDPTPLVGLMYGTFRTYKNAESIPLTLMSIRKAYIDTADEGKDYLCSICYFETEFAMFVTDVLYTADPMEVTEPATALQLKVQRTNVARIESNNGGRGFARQVETQTRIIKNLATEITWFHQSLNKKVRINTNSAKATNLIYMLEGWDSLWPKFYKAVTKYRKEGKNAHDDAPDAITGMVEYFGKDQLQNTDEKVLSVFG